MIQKTDALNEITTLGYDLTGLPGHPECTGPTLGSSKATKRVDGNGKVIYFAYDGLDRDIIDIHKQGGTDYQITPNDAVVYTAYRRQLQPHGEDGAGRQHHHLRL